jgi:hypothetical protein
VDDLAVARVHPSPDGVFRLDDDDLAASPRSARDREPTRADDEAFDRFPWQPSARLSGDAQQPAGDTGQTSTMPPSAMMTCPVM